MIKKKMIFPVLITVIVVFLLSSIMGFKSTVSQEPAITSSKECKECHAEIYDHWKNAMHSMSIEDPIFKAS